MEIIAEIGQNFNGDMVLAHELIHSAKECGADVAKFQLYNAKSLFPKEGNEWYEYNCSTELSRDNIYELNSTCQNIGIEFMASVFDVERISWLEEVNVKRYKVASRSVHDVNLINALVDTGKPILISLGMWHETEFPKIKSNNVDYLYCISKYPTPLQDISLSSVDFKKIAGFSDHSIGVTAAIAAMSRGANIIEKHFTLDKKMYGPDHEGSMSPDELKIITSFRSELLKCL
jgi:sialic acid synthase SpsE